MQTLILNFRAFRKEKKQFAHTSLNLGRLSTEPENKGGNSNLFDTVRVKILLK